MTGLVQTSAGTRLVRPDGQWLSFMAGLGFAPVFAVGLNGLGNH